MCKQYSVGGNFLRKNQRKSTIISFAIIACLFMTLLGTVNAIINGQPDGEEHPYVCVFAVGYQNDPLDPADDIVLWAGTGILISPTIVLTAGHNLDAPPGVDINVRFEPDGSIFPPFGFGGISGTGYIHPDYSIGESRTLKDWISHDVGIIVLDVPAPVTEYGVLPTEGLVDTLPMKSDVDLVGYGFQRQIKGDHGPPYWDFSSALVRTYAHAQLITSKHKWGDEFIKTTQNPAKGKGGICFGDSGGPVLVGGTDTIIGVISWATNNNAKGVAYSSRIDTADVLAFINNFLP